MGETNYQGARQTTAAFLDQTIANFFLRIQKPRIPTKLFTSEEMALHWLQGFAVDSAPPELTSTQPDEKSTAGHHENGWPSRAT